MNRYSAKTGVKAEVVCANNVARLKLIVRRRNLTINDPKGVFRSLQIGKNIGTSDKMLVQIVCKGKVNLSYNNPVKSLTVPSLVSKNNHKILNKFRQTIHQVNYQEEVLDDLAEDSDDEQMIEHEFVTDLSSAPSLSLGSGIRYMVIDSSMPSSLAEVSDDQADSDDEQMTGSDFINSSSSRSKPFGSGLRYIFIDQSMPSFQPVPSLLEGMESDPLMLSSKTMPSLLSRLEADQSNTPMKKSDPVTILPRLIPGPRWSIQSMPSVQSELHPSDDMEIDDPDLPPLSEDNPEGGENDPDVARPLWQLTSQKSSSVVGASKSEASRMVPRSRPKLPGVTPPVSRRSRNIKRSGDTRRDFSEKLAWLRAHDKNLPSVYHSKQHFTKDEKLIISSRYEKIKSLQKQSPAAASESPPPVKRSKSVGRGDGDARRNFTTALSYCKRHDPNNPLYSKISYTSADKTKIMSTYQGLKLSGALSPISSMIPLAYSSRSLSSKQDSSSSVGVDIVT
ncbi:MAG: hypothetical protein J0L79_06170 [Rickettsiales bacterium]|nr:hypothetical protein [Rickettsiales bacterium]MCA0254925.1 hypothetical protein [Pseudomonadota bacterium]